MFLLQYSIVNKYKLNTVYLSLLLLLDLLLSLRLLDLLTGELSFVFFLELSLGEPGLFDRLFFDLLGDLLLDLDLLDGDFGILREDYLTEHAHLCLSHRG